MSEQPGKRPEYNAWTCKDSIIVPMEKLMYPLTAHDAPFDERHDKTGKYAHGD